MKQVQCYQPAMLGGDPHHNQMLQSMRVAGVYYDGSLVADGRLHRFKAQGDHARNSWYVLHGGSPAAGVFGCWKRQIKEAWSEHDGKQVSKSERQAVRQRIQKAEAERIRVEELRHRKAQKVAEWIFSRSTPADPSHRYLTTKRVNPHGEIRQRYGKLVLPLREADGKMHSLQLIGGDGFKTFLRGGRIKGCMYTLADDGTGPIVVCEGYATAASIFEATGMTTIAVMNCGNFLAVAKVLRANHPDREIIIAADNDVFTTTTDGKPYNPGVVKATEAAKVIHAQLAIPHFKTTIQGKTDFNDLSVEEGLNTVKTQIEAVRLQKKITVGPRPVTMNEPDDYDDCRPAFTPPTWIEVMAAVAGSPIATYMQQASAAGEIPPEFLLLDGILLGCVVLTNAKRRIGIEHDFAPRNCNAYAAKLAASGLGKGLSSSVFLASAKELGVQRLRANSEAGLAGFCTDKGAQPGVEFGLFYQPEISKMIDPRDPTAIQLKNAFLAAFDEGILSWTTAPRGRVQQHLVDPFAPSLLIEGQPKVVEAAGGRSTLDSGYLARFLVAWPEVRQRVRKTGAVDINAIVTAYEILRQDTQDLVRPSVIPDSLGDAYLKFMLDEEIAAWQRLSGDYKPRIAAILTGGENITDSAPIRAGVVADWFFGQAIKLQSIIHADPWEALRRRMERLIVEHPGCSTRFLYKALKCSSRQFETDLSPTLIARGVAQRAKVGRSDRWYPLRPQLSPVTEKHPSDTLTAVNQGVIDCHSLRGSGGADNNTNTYPISIRNDSSQVVAAKQPDCLPPPIQELVTVQVNASQPAGLRLKSEPEDIANDTH